MIYLKTDEEIELLRENNLLVSRALAEVGRNIRPGVTTLFLNNIAEEFIRDNGAEPAFLGYQGYPASACISVNEQVVHGIPGDRVIEEGDIVSVDLGTFLKGFVGDSAYTFAVGEVSAEARKLLEVTKEALYKGTAQAKAGNRVGDISSAVQRYVENRSYSVVRDFVGHGVGAKLHEEPSVPNFGTPGRGPRLIPGMTIAIEPMVNMGDYKVKVLNDDWTTVTVDNSLSAHFEHTIAITPDGPKILTIADDEVHL